MSHARVKLGRKSRIGLIVSVLGLAMAVGVGSPASATGSATSPQPASKADTNPGGANGQCPGGPYCSSRDGSPSLNGSGTGVAGGKPCAGCVGKADNKNPPGQMPNGSDHNNGYECDGNHGIGRSNPAHTGCTTTGTTTGGTTTGGTTTGGTTTGGTTTGGTTTGGTTTGGTTTVGNAAVVNPAVSGAAMGGQPQILGKMLVAPEMASQVTHPLPAFAAAGEADTSGQLSAGGFAALAAFLALGSGVVLRRRHGGA